MCTEMTIKKKISDAIEAKKLIIGIKNVREALKTGNLNSVIRARNCPESIVRDLEHYGKLSDTEIENTNDDSSRLGEYCGKPFNIIVVGIKK